MLQPSHEVLLPLSALAWVAGGPRRGWEKKGAGRGFVHGLANLLVVGRMEGSMVHVFACNVDLRFEKGFRFLCAREAGSYLLASDDCATFFGLDGDFLAGTPQT